MTPIDAVGNGLILPREPAALVTEPEPGLQRQVLVHSAAMMLVRHQMRKGWHGSPHRHPHEQMVYIISGTIRVVIAVKNMCGFVEIQLSRISKYTRKNAAYRGR